MFGWEFPPFKSGGLGTACYDLTKGMAKKGTNITFVMPCVPKKAKAKFVKLFGANKLGIKIRKVNSNLRAYITEKEYYDEYKNLPSDMKSVYGENLYDEVERYSKAATQIAKKNKHAIIHVHDWMTYKAGINAKKASRKPLIAHIHATEFDRTGGNPNPFISHIEYEGLLEADKVIANSNYTKQNVIEAYKINPDKIEVVHWGIDDVPKLDVEKFDEKTVLFLGRMTLQKGPEYFVQAAEKVIEYEPTTKFVMVGDGDMLPRMMNYVGEKGIAKNFIFTGRLKGNDVHKAFRKADLYVMPSVSEPFGLVALESLKNKTPVIISKQSGVSEVLKNALAVDFWDTHELANKILGVLKYPPLYEELKQNGIKEVKEHDIDKPAEKVLNVYKKFGVIV